MLQQRRSWLRKGQPNPHTTQYRTQQGVNTADELLWQEQQTQDTQFSPPFSIWGPLSGSNCTSSFPAATSPGQSCCLNTSLPQLRSQLFQEFLFQLKNEFILSRHKQHSYFKPVYMIFQKRSFLYLSRLHLLWWRQQVTRNRRQNQCSHTDFHRFATKSIWQRSTSSSQNSNTRA